MRTYWLRSPAGWRKAMSLDAIERLVEQLPADAQWEIYVQAPRGRRRRLRSGTGPHVTLRSI